MRRKEGSPSTCVPPSCLRRERPRRGLRMRRALEGPAVASRCPTAGAPLPPRPRGLPGPRVSAERRGGGKQGRAGARSGFFGLQTQRANK